MKKTSLLAKIISLALIAMSLLIITTHAMADTATHNLVHTKGNSPNAKYLYKNITKAPTFSIRVAGTLPQNTGNVKLNYNDLTVSETYYKTSNILGVAGGMTEKTLTTGSLFGFDPKRTNRVQIELIATNGTVYIQFNKK